MNTKAIYPWLYVAGAFILLLAAWTSLIFVAVKHTPESVPIQTQNHSNQ